MNKHEAAALANELAAALFDRGDEYLGASRVSRLACMYSLAEGSTQREAMGGGYCEAAVAGVLLRVLLTHRPERRKKARR